MSDAHFDRAEFLRYFRDESEELLGLVESDLLRLETAIGSERADPDLVNSLFRALHTMKGSAGMLEMEAVSGLAHHLEEVCALLRKDRLRLSGPLVDLLFEGRDLLSACVRAQIEGSEEPAGLAAFEQRLVEFSAIDERLGAAPATISYAEHAVEGRNAGRAGTIRVDIARLDVLLDLVGELVINRTRIADLAAELGRRLLPPDVVPLVRGLIESAAGLSRTSGEMQEAIMHVRMVPIGGVFERFPRFVRDLARAQGKEVELILEGTETNLDKTIVDRIGEPLMHLVRNCIDHGIEAPAARKEGGKPASGTIWLRASHIGNQTVVEISDDGTGIDVDRVRARAVEDGLVAATAAGQLLQNEILQLIFAPGFSTARAVSNVSGRGVGMDVVQRAIARLGGTIEIDSVAGVGTRFTLKLPLTLAIAQALLIRVATELYAIPLDMVIESRRIDAAQIETVRGIETVRLRERVLPLIRLGEFFGFRAAQDRDPLQALVVVTVVGGRHYGLVVDEFIGDQEVVIKPLSDLVGRIAGISGATILGDGSIALILDASSLVHAVAADALARVQASA